MSNHYLTFLTKPLQSWEQISSHFRISTLFSLAVRILLGCFLWVRKLEVIWPEVECCTQVGDCLYGIMSLSSLVSPECLCYSTLEEVANYLPIWKSQRSCLCGSWRLYTRKLEVVWSRITSNKEVGGFWVRQKKFTIYSLFGSPCRAPAVLYELSCNFSLTTLCW